MSHLARCSCLGIGVLMAPALMFNRQPLLFSDQAIILCGILLVSAACALLWQECLQLLEQESLQ